MNKTLMKNIAARWPINIGDVTIKTGEIGRLATLEEARTAFPGLNYKPGSMQVSVLFRDLRPCVVRAKDVIL